MLPLLALLLTASPELEEGRVQFSALKYAAAVQSLTKAAANASAPVAERVEANDLLARAHLALGHAPQAQAAYEALLALDPMAEEPKAAPKVVAAFRRAKEAKFPRDFVQLVRRPRGADVVEVEVVNPWRTSLQLELVEATTGAFAARPMPLERNVALATLTPGCRFYVRAVTADGRTLARLGSETEALAGPPAPAPPVAVAVAPPVKQEPVPPPPPPSVTPDAPKKEASPLDAILNPRLVPLAPGIAPMVKSSKLRAALGWSLIAVGALAVIGGAIVLGLGVSDTNQAAGWPLNGISFDDYNSLKRSGETKTVIGAALLGGGALFGVAGGVLVGTAGD